jgi:hypothetical protein
MKGQSNWGDPQLEEYLAEICNQAENLTDFLDAVAEADSKESAGAESKVGESSDEENSASTIANKRSTKEILLASKSDPDKVARVSSLCSTVNNYFQNQGRKGAKNEKDRNNKIKTAALQNAIQLSVTRRKNNNTGTNSSSVIPGADIGASIQINGFVFVVWYT